MQEGDLHVFIPYEDSILSGRLKLDNEQTLLTVFSRSPVVQLPDYIECIGENGQKISLLKCLSYGGGSASTYGEQVFSCRAFPHYVLIGGFHCTIDEHTTKGIYFTLSDSEELFWDLSPWQWVDKKLVDDSILDADHQASIFGFIGSGKIFGCKAAPGGISAYHSPTFTVPSISGFQAKNRITVCIDLEEPTSVRKALKTIYLFAHFAEVCSGRSQGISDISILSSQTIDESPATLDLSISHNDIPAKTGESVTHYDMLAAPSLGRQAFENLVTNWFSISDSKRLVSISRFSTNLKQARFYDANRLVSAASLFEWFDLSRSHSVPQEITAIVEGAAAALRVLRKSDDQQKLLNMLGHVGAETLRSKILRQLNDVLDALSDWQSFDRAGCELAIKWAVKCRNKIVHGSGEPKVERVLENHMSFLTETLEVLFAFLALHTAGWDIRSRIEQRFDAYGKYGSYIMTMKTNAARLQCDTKP